MIDINLSDNVLVVEPDPIKLDEAIHTALNEARNVIKLHYLCDFKTVPDIDIRISTGRQANNYKNGAQIIFHFLSPPKISLLGSYVELLDQILSCPYQNDIPFEMISQLVFWSSDKIDRWRKVDHYKIVIRHALKAVFVSLLRQRAVLLPADKDRFLPVENGVWRGFKLMPDRLQEMAAVYYAGSGLEYGVDWALCTYSWNNVSIMEHGIEQVPAKAGKRQLVQLAMCTRWESLDEIDPADIDILKELFNLPIIGLYLTYLYLKHLDKQKITPNFFRWVDHIPSLRIYVEEYALYAQREKFRRSTIKRNKAGVLKKSPAVAGPSLKERVYEVIIEATKNDKLDGMLLARLLGRLAGRTKLAPTEDWPEESILPESFTFNWANDPAHWLAGFKLHETTTNYASKCEFNAFAPFMFYLTIYLPVYFDKNPDSNASYPKRIENLNGYNFISRPIEDTSRNLPLPYVQFVREYYKEASPQRSYTAIRKLYKFFQEIIGRREYLNIPSSFVNPVLETDIPGCGGRPTKTTKKRLPQKAYWLSLLYAYKIYDYVAIINEKCLNEAVYGYNYSRLHHNLDEDELGIVDIRDILNDQDVDRVVKFDGEDYEVNLVPSYFFLPVELPLKNKGKRFVIRPHCIAHLICTLETGIRNQHIQWLSYDFDKHIPDEKIDTENVYQLFVKTDKSNKSWTALTAGRVIKVLREMRIFRDLVDVEAFDKEICYEGRKNSPYRPFKLLFSYSLVNGYPHSDTVYEQGFRYLMAGLQYALDHYHIDFNLFEFNPESSQRVFRIRPKLSPHSMRVTVVSEYVQFLNSEYVGRYITNQKLATVWYYTKFDADALRKMQADQQRGLAQFNRENGEVRLLGSGGITIDATNPNSMLANAFKEDPKQAIVDFGAVSSNFFRGENGIGIVSSNTRFNLSFEPTHICPFNRICPADRHKMKYANRCNFCDYAIRTIDHLPSLECRRRDLGEELDRLEAYIKVNSGKLTEGLELDLDQMRSIMAEDLASLELAVKVLEQNRLQRQHGENTQLFHVYKPEMIVKEAESIPFPDIEERAVYFMARLQEVQSFPDDQRQLLDMNLLILKNHILANTGNIRELMKRESNIDPIEAEVFSMINSIKSAYGLTNDQIIEIANRDIDQMIPIGLSQPHLIDMNYTNLLTFPISE